MKDILTLTDEEILDEMAEVFEVPVQLPRKIGIGFLTDTPSTYYSDNKVDELELARLYNESDKLRDIAIVLAINSLRNRKDELFDHIKSKQYSRVLDYGCGTGTHGIACIQRGAQVTFFDISKFMLDITQKRCKSRNLEAEFINDESQLLNDNYDFIICTDVIEHHPHPDQMLFKFIDTLKLGGIAHLHISRHVCYERGHLAQSIKCWDTCCQTILQTYFTMTANYTYKLIKKR